MVVVVDKVEDKENAGEPKPMDADGDLTDGSTDSEAEAKAAKEDKPFYKDQEEETQRWERQPRQRSTSRNHQDDRQRKVEDEKVGTSIPYLFFCTQGQPAERRSYAPRFPGHLRHFSHRIGQEPPRNQPKRVQTI